MRLWQFIYWQVGLEVIFWTSGLAYLAIHNPWMVSSFSFCPLESIGFHYCPGCGLGRSISFFIHGAVSRSFETHILGIPAAVLVVHRTINLLVDVFRRRAGSRHLIINQGS